MLRIRPHAFNGQNAYYDPRNGALNFGYFDADGANGRNLPRGRVFTCLSHDIIAHETTHALLDGMRARFRLPTNPDVLAFHEGFADLVAIFLHFTHRGVVRAAIERSDGSPESDKLLLSVAQQFGQTMTSRENRPDHCAAQLTCSAGETTTLRLFQNDTPKSRRNHTSWAAYSCPPCLRHSQWCFGGEPNNTINLSDARPSAEPTPN